MKHECERSYYELDERYAKEKNARYLGVCGGCGETVFTNVLPAGSAAWGGK